MEVFRRFSDFLGLRERLVEKHLHLGVIIPPPPEKSIIGTWQGVGLNKRMTLKCVLNPLSPVGPIFRLLGILVMWIAVVKGSSI